MASRFAVPQIGGDFVINERPSINLSSTSLYLLRISHYMSLTNDNHVISVSRSTSGLVVVTAIVLLECLVWPYAGFTCAVLPLDQSSF